MREMTSQDLGIKISFFFYSHIYHSLQSLTRLIFILMYSSVSKFATITIIQWYTIHHHQQYQKKKSFRFNKIFKIKNISHVDYIKCVKRFYQRNTFQRQKISHGLKQNQINHDLFQEKVSLNIKDVTIFCELQRN